MKSIFDFSEYRGYLRAYIKSLPKQGHGEAKRISGHLNVSSTFVSQMLSGQKLLTPEQAEYLSEYLGHTNLESDYFFNLVQLDRAGTERLKKYLKQKLTKIKDESLQLIKRLEPKKVLSDEDKAIFYSSAIYSSIHAYTSTGDKGRNLDKIMERFELSRSKAVEILKFLIDAGLVVEIENKFQVSTQSTHVAQGSPHLLKHHANWRIKAIQTSENLNETELMYTAQVSLSKDDFIKLREEMAIFLKSFLKTIHASPAEEIACLNLDWFWIRK